MKSKALMAAAIAAVFGMTPLHAADDKASSAASGTSAEKSPEAAFKDLDKNSDGSISREEAKGSPRERDFDKLDKDNDGKLSRDEHGAAQNPSAAGSATGSSSAAGSGASK